MLLAISLNVRLSLKGGAHMHPLAYGPELHDCFCYSCPFSHLQVEQPIPRSLKDSLLLIVVFCILLHYICGIIPTKF